MTELCIYQTTNTVLKNDLIIVVFYCNLTDVRKKTIKGDRMKRKNADVWNRDKDA